MKEHKKKRIHFVLDVEIINKIEDQVKFVNLNKPDGSVRLKRSQLVNAYLKQRLIDPLDTLQIRESELTIKLCNVQKQIALIFLGRNIYNKEAYEMRLKGLDSEIRAKQKLLDEVLCGVAIHEKQA